MGRHGNLFSSWALEPRPSTFLKAPVWRGQPCSHPRPCRATRSQRRRRRPVGAHQSDVQPERCAVHRCVGPQVPGRRHEGRRRRGHQLQVRLLRSVGEVRSRLHQGSRQSRQVFCPALKILSSVGSTGARTGTLLERKCRRKVRRSFLLTKSFEIWTGPSQLTCLQKLNTLILIRDHNSHPELIDEPHWSLFGLVRLHSWRTAYLLWLYMFGSIGARSNSWISFLLSRLKLRGRGLLRE